MLHNHPGPYRSIARAHINVAHFWWTQHLRSGDIAVDATCGNGFDTAALAKLLLPQLSGSLFAMDLQDKAIVATKQRVAAEVGQEAALGVTFLRQCHSQFPLSLLPATVKLIVYNLGYLPGGDKTVTTQGASTLASLGAALPLIAPGGAISITCYPGHPAGAEELAAILSWAVSLDYRLWGCCHHHWVNRPLSPTWLLLTRTAE